jgi:RimJ/RimL family protein N-acetyltransferase
MAASPDTPATQPVGPSLPGWQPRPHPEPRCFAGRYCRVTPLDPAAHADALYAALCSPAHHSAWTYLLTTPPADAAAWCAELEQRAASRDPLFFTLSDEAGAPAGLASYLRIVPQHGVIEVGHIHLSPRLQQTRAATEAQFLLMRHAFDELGYRRYEWKCDALNAPSRRAALRLGFQYEGIFRNAIVYKGRSRDTAWYSITDAEWPAVRAAFENWLAPENFDAAGRQRSSLSSLRDRSDSLL